MSGLEGDTAMAPTEELAICPSVTGVHDVPPSMVFHRPPPVAPKKYSNGREGDPAAAIDRPPRSGPMLRHCSASSGTGRMAARDCAKDVTAANDANTKTTAAVRCFMLGILMLEW